MSLPVVLTPEAEAEFDEAADWYEQQAGLGAAFTAAVKEVFLRVSRTPLVHQTVYQDIRRGVVRRFPYSVFYRADPSRVTVSPCSPTGVTLRFGRGAFNQVMRNFDDKKGLRSLIKLLRFLTPLISPVHPAEKRNRQDEQDGQDERDSVMNSPILPVNPVHLSKYSPETIGDLAGRRQAEEGRRLPEEHGCLRHQVATLICATRFLVVWVVLVPCRPHATTAKSA